MMPYGRGACPRIGYDRRVVHDAWAGTEEIEATRAGRTISERTRLLEALASTLGGSDSVGVGIAAGGPDGSGPAAPHGYRLLEILGSGGCGEVWSAVQPGLGRVVALKRFKSGVGTHSPDSTLRRLTELFRREAILSGLLEHPNIVPIYDLIEGDDGLPALSLKRIEGETWHDRLDADRAAGLGADELLDRHLPVLLDVARAVAFAHSRGICHLDLKPRQVLLGAFGETLLTDWGLARVYDRQRLAAVLEREVPDRVLPDRGVDGSSGTPLFMAPEQADDQAGSVGPWTDVYLLGGCLYHLLTGRYPHEGRTWAVTVRLAASGSVLPVLQVAPGHELPEGLVDLAERSLSGAIPDRPRDAAEFLGLLEAELGGARRRRQSEELTRSAAEEFDDAEGVYQGLTPLLGRLERAEALWPDNPEIAPLRRRARLRLAQDALEARDLRLAAYHSERLDAGTDRDGLVEEIDAAARQRRSRRRQRHLAIVTAVALGLLVVVGSLLFSARVRDESERARQAREDAEALVEFMVDDLRESLEDVGRLDLLDSVGQEVVRYFERLPETASEDPSRLHLARALGTIGEALFEQGRLDEADRALHHGLEIVSGMSGADVLRAEVDLRSRVSAVSARRGRFDEALEHHLRTREILEDLLVASPEDGEIRRDLAVCAVNLSVTHWERRRVEDQRREAETALTLLEPLLEDGPAGGAVDVWTIAATARDLLSLAASLDGDAAETLRQKRREKEIFERLAEESPENRRLANRLGQARVELATLLWREGRVAEGEEEMRRVLRDQEDLVAFDPTNVDWRRDLASARGALAALLEEAGRQEEAEDLLLRELEERESVLAGSPDVVALHREAGDVLERLSRHFESRNMSGPARAFQERENRITRALVEMEDSEDARELLAHSLLRLARLAADEGRTEDALEDLEEADAVVAVLREDVASRAGQGLFGRAALLRARVAADLGRDGESVAALRRGFEGLEGLEPGAAEQGELRAWTELAARLGRKGDVERALPHLASDSDAWDPGLREAVEAVGADLASHDQAP